MGGLVGGRAVRAGPWRYWWLLFFKFIFFLSSSQLLCHCLCILPHAVVKHNFFHVCMCLRGSDRMPESQSRVPWCIFSYTCKTSQSYWTAAPPERENNTISHLAMLLSCEVFCKHLLLEFLLLCCGLQTKGGEICHLAGVLELLEFQNWWKWKC